MPLKYKIITESEIPEKYIDLYVQRDGVFILDVEGAVDFDKFKEFRTNNTKLYDENKKIKADLEKIGDLDKAIRLLEVAGTLDPEDLEKAVKKGSIDVEKVVEARTKAMKEDFGRRNKASTEENEKLVNRLGEVEINQAVMAEATKRGLRSTAHQDIVGRARQVFRIDEGRVKAFEADGKTIKYGSDGSDLQMSEWMDTQQTKEAVHLFDPSGGSGATGSGNGKATGNNFRKQNPFSKEHFNVTKQMELRKENPELAKKLQDDSNVVARPFAGQ